MRFLFGILFAVVAFYGLAYGLNLLPAEYMPDQLWKYVSTMTGSNQAAAKPGDKPAKPEDNFITAPINKAKDAVKNYDNSINEEKKQLDNL